MKGFSTIEMLIAMTIALMSISAIVLVAMQDQSTLTSGETSIFAAERAHALLQKEFVLADKDFNLVNGSVVAHAPYTDTVTVETLPDNVTKRVTAKVAWNGEHGQESASSYFALISNSENPNAGSTCSSVTSGDWTHLHVTTFEFGRDLIGDAISIYPLSAIDVRNHRLYAAVDSTSAATAKDFFILDTTNPHAPHLLGSLDTNTNVIGGLNAVQNAGDYVYAANAHKPNFATCVNTNGTNPSCAQLQIVTVANPASPAVIYNFKVPGVTGSGGQGIGNTLMYHDGFVYLGLSKTLAGPEFNVIDVHTPSAPQYLGGFQVGRGIANIFVKNGYAYVATDDNARELLILDVHDPAHIVSVGTFDAPGTINFGLGKGLALIGDRLYFGRTFVGNAPELYVLDVADRAHPLPLGSLEIGTSVDGVIVRDHLAFVLTNTQFQIWNIDDPAAIASFAPPTYLTGVGRAMDCAGNDMFAVSVDAANKGFLSVFSGAP